MIGGIATSANTHSAYQQKPAARSPATAAAEKSLTQRTLPLGEVVVKVAPIPEYNTDFFEWYEQSSPSERVASRKQAIAAYLQNLKQRAEGYHQERRAAKSAR